MRTPSENSARSVNQLITLIAAAIPVFFFCYFPSETTDIIKSLGTTLFGG